MIDPIPDPPQSEKPALAANKEPAALKPDAQKPSEKPPKLQGRAVEFPLPEPWPDAVNGSDVLDAIFQTFARHLGLPLGAAPVFTVWCAHAHVFDAFLCSPRLNVCSPQPGCGKTTALDLVTLFVPKPLKTENISVATLFRVVEMAAPTLLVDEADSFLKGNEELRGLLNASHRRGGQVLRCVGDEHEVRAFRVFAPVVLSGIGQLPPTLHARSIVVSLIRAKPDELPARFDSRHTSREVELCRKLARWTADNRTAIEACDPALPAGCHNRTADNWRPLFAIAEVAGGPWPELMRQAFAALETGTDTAAQGRGVELLADLREVFAATGRDKLPSKHICEALAQREDRPWPEYRDGRPISPVQLARLLKPYRVTPRDVRINLEVLKGYHLEDFADAFARYLPPTDESATPATDQ